MSLESLLATRPACVHERGQGDTVATCFACEAITSACWLENTLDAPAVIDDAAHNLYDLGRDKRRKAIPWELLPPSRKQPYLNQAYTVLVTIFNHQNYILSIREGNSR